MALNRKRFAAQLVGAHTAAALLLKDNTWIISDTDGEALGNAICDVFEHYQITVSPLALAYLNLLGVSAAIYGPRIARKAIQKRAREKQQREEILRRYTGGAPVDTSPPNPNKPAPKKGDVINFVGGMPVV